MEIFNNKVDFKCPICDSLDLIEKYKDSLKDSFPSFNYSFNNSTNRHYRILECQKCTHCFASPRHKDLYFNYKSNEVDNIYLSLANQRLLTNQEVLKILLKFVEEGNLIDIGCATGDFLLCSNKYYDSEGLDLSKWALKIAQERGIKVYNSLIEDFKKNECYDVATLWGVIEHFEFPKEEILNIKRILKPNGVIALWTGDISSLTAKLMGEKWHYIMGQHIQYFTKTSMRKLFNESGFKEIYMGIFPYVITPASLLNTLNRYPLVYNTLKPLLTTKCLFNKQLILKLPGELFCLFQKKSSQY